MAQAAVIFVHFIEHRIVIAGVNNNADIGMVFSSCAHHGRTANIDVFDGGGQVAIGIGDGFLKGIQIYHDHVDRRNVVALHYLIIDAATTQNAAVNFWVQGFNATVHHFRKAGVV